MEIADVAIVRINSGRYAPTMASLELEGKLTSYRIDADAKEDAKFDGLFVLRTNTSRWR